MSYQFLRKYFFSKSSNDLALIMFHGYFSLVQQIFRFYSVSPVVQRLHCEASLKIPRYQGKY